MHGKLFRNLAFRIIIQPELLGQLITAFILGLKFRSVSQYKLCYNQKH